MGAHRLLGNPQHLGDLDLAKTLEMDQGDDLDLTSGETAHLT
jgi:hypothetical protein